MLDISLEDLARNYSCDDVAKFLSKIELSEYIETFKEIEVSGDVLLGIVLDSDVDGLEELQMKKSLHQMKIKQLFPRELKRCTPKYSTDHLCTFLEEKQQKLVKYAPELRSHAIDGDMILDVDDILMKKALMEVGLSKLETIKLISTYKTFVKNNP